VVDTGMRRLLGLSAVGIAIMATLPTREVDAIHARNAIAYRDSRLTLGTLRDVVKFAQVHGYSESTDWRTRETSGVGCAFAASASMLLGISIAAVNSRMTMERKRELGQLLLTEKSQLEAEFAGAAGRA
jgi:DNA-binding IclR family transcriptional regulator